MIGTFVSVGLIGGAISAIKKRQRGDDDIEKKWDELMIRLGIKAKGDGGDTYTILKKIKRIYGHDIIVKIPSGLKYSTLESIDEEIRICFACHVITIDYKRKSATAYIRLVTLPLDDNTMYQPVKIFPWELYLGTTRYHKDIVVDMKTHTHLLLAGTTGVGKSMFLVQILLNLIINFKDDEVNLYLNEIADKDDFKPFRRCGIVKNYSRTLEDALRTLKKLKDDMLERNNLFSKYDDIRDIYDYNKKFPHNKLPYSYFVTDEYSLLMEDKSDSEESSAMKGLIQTYMIELGKLARNCGIYVVSCVQRPDRESLPPPFKTNLNVIVAFRQRNGASALTVLDSYKPMKLKEREAIVDYGGQDFEIYSLYINNYIIKRYIGELIDYNHKYIDLSKYDGFIKDVKKPKKKEKSKKKESTIKEIATATDSEKVVDLESKGKRKKKGEI